MSIRNLNDESLIVETKKAALAERAALSNVLNHLREVDRRRLYSDYHCKSLHEFARTQLGYTEAEAALRVSATRILKDLPEIETKINDGSLSLSNLNLAQKIFASSCHEDAGKKRAQEPQSQFASLVSKPPEVPKFDSSESKLALLAKIENKSKREAIVILQAETKSKPEAATSESIKNIPGDKVELKLIFTHEEFNQLLRLKNLLAHRHPNLSLSKLTALLIELGLAKFDPAKKAERSQLRRQKQPTSSANGKAKNQVDATVHETLSGKQPRPKVTQCEIELAPVPEPKRCVTKLEARTPPTAVLKNQIWLRDRGICSNCGLDRAVEIDHIIPVALGGENKIENLRLLCRCCNQRAAIRELGIAKMETFLR